MQHERSILKKHSCFCNLEREHWLTRFLSGRLRVITSTLDHPNSGYIQLFQLGIEGAVRTGVRNLDFAFLEMRRAAETLFIKR